MSMEGEVGVEGHSRVMAVNKNCSKGWGMWENTTVGLREQGKSQDRGQFTRGYYGLSTKPFLSAAFPALTMEKEQGIFRTRFYPKKTFKLQKK